MTTTFPTEMTLSEEMIEKICRVSFGRIWDLKKKEKAIQDIIATGQGNTRRNRIRLCDIKTAKEEANEVHELFFELLKRIDPCKYDLDDECYDPYYFDP